MKKTLLPLLALAAFAVSAHAADWFDAEIAGYTTWPTNPPAGEWTGTEGATLDAANQALVIDAPMGTTVAFEPTASKDVADEQVVFSMTATLSAVQPIANLRPLEADKKGSLAAATDGSATNYYGWAKDPAGTTNTWLALTGATPAVGTPLAVRVFAKAANGDFYVQYEVGGVTLAAGSETWLPVAADDTTLGHAGMRGRNFAVSSLSGATEAYPSETATLTVGDLPANVTLVSVTADGVPVEDVEGVYTVADGATVVATFAPAPGYRLVGTATVTVAVNGDTVLATADMPTAEAIPVVSLTLPELPANVSLVSVTTNGIAVEAVEGAYPVYDGAEVVVTFAAAQGYVLTGSATVSVVMDGDQTLDGIPTAVTIASLIKINEIMASNPSVDKGGIASEKGIAEMDWIELYNGAPVDVDLTGWHLSDNAKPGKEDKATILGSCVIPAKGYKIVWLDKIHVDPSEYAADEAFAVLKLSSSGEFLQLADPSKAVVQQVDFSTKKQIKGVSYGPLSVSSGAGLVPGNGPFVYMKTATPGAANATEGFGDFTPAVAFSEPHGYKTAAFDLELSCPDAPAAQIYYTLDGSSPTTASTPYTGAIHVDRTTVVRAAVPVENTILQFDTSATYIFLDDILTQARSTTTPATAVGFPDDNAVNNQEMLYGMRQDIVTGTDRDRLLRGFTNSIATLSIVVDPANLFNSSTGIYVNPKGEGESWERQIMLEGFAPTGVGADFAQPAGIRIRGGFSRQNNKPKHSLRFFFRSSYGESSLAQKMFVGEPLSLNGEGKMKEEAGEYDKLDLRTSQNASWANENSDKDTFVTEVFSRDSQRDLGQPYTRSRYYNLFINGQYWGLYQTQERGDEHWAEAYLGGDSLQYDLIKTASTFVGSTIKYSIECNEGTWDAWSNLWEIATTEGFGPGHEDNYNKILGLNPDGTRNDSYPILLNAESLMVYMLVSHYVVDRDGPTSPYSSYEKGHANNFYALRNRDDAGAVKGFVFLRHDAEFSMGQHSDSEARDNPTLWGTEECTVFTGAIKHRTIPFFTPAELHFLLMKNPVYKRQYADLFYRECLREGGAMTVENATARYTSRMAEIDDAIVCEAARWGQGKTRSTWLNACKTSTTFITNRLGFMKTQYQDAGWYPTNAAPFVANEDGVRYFDGGEVPYQGKVSLQNNDAQGDGTLYYTIDGTDPADSGLAYTAPFSIPDSGATVRARLFKDNEWSPLEEVALEMDIPNDQRYGIRVAAILNAAVDDPADEFIVLTNKLDRAVDLNGLSIWSEKTGQELVKLAEITSETILAAGGTIKLTRAEYWPDPTETLKLKNGAINVDLRDYNGKRIQHTVVDSGTWFWTGEYDEKGKKVYACNKTGRWFIATEFLGDTDGGDVTLETQWMASPEAPSTVTLTVPAVANATVSATTNGVALAGADDGNGNTVFTIEPGTAVTVTYTAAEGYHVAGSANDVTTAVYVVSADDTAADHTLAVDATMAIVAHAAVISVADAETGACTTNAVYATLAAAVAAASDGETVLLLADDSASFTTDNLEIGIGKSITIDGDGHTLYGLDDYTGGRGDHDIYISGSADITIRNITLADFGGAVPVTGRTYPIWTGSAYSGTLTLDNVTVTNFNRTAFNLNGGTVVVRNCTIAGDMGKGFPGGVFQEGIEAYNANVTVENTTITGAGSTYEKEDSQIAACIQLGNPNGPTPGTGSITVRSGTFAGQYGIIVASNAMNAVTVQGGAFTGALLVEEGEGGSIAVSGGTFDAPVPAEFVADGYAPTTIADNDGRYTVRTARTVSFTVDGASYTNLVVADGEPVAQPADPVSDAYVFTGWTHNGAAYEFSTPVTEDIELEAAITSLAAATWIGGAEGDWETAASWDIGYVPTKATIVTFTNDAQVAILGSTDRCKELVLSNANVTLVRDANAAKPVLHFHGNEGRAVSVASGETGSLGVNGIALFTESTDRDNNLTIGCALAVLGDVTFRGINIIPNQLAASFTITGKTTISADATVKTIDWGNTIFLGGIEVAKGVTAKIQTDPNGYAQIGAAVTLVANDGEGDSTTIWLMRSSNRSGKVSLVLGASVSVDADHAATHFIKTSSDEVTDENGLNPITCDVYEAARNPTVFVTTYGVTVTGVENEQRVVPGTNLVIGVSGFAAGYEPSVTIVKHEDYSVLLTTNAVSFTYTMPNFDIDVVAEAISPRYNDPEGNEIKDQGLIDWLSGNGFSQEDINALGHDAAATDKLYECWLLNCSITAENPGGTIHTTGIAVTNGVVSIRVRLDRNAPLGHINGVVHLYGAETLAGGFGDDPISEEIVGFSEGDSTFAIAKTDDSVSQFVTATFSPTDVTARFFQSAIEFPSPDNGGGGEEGDEED